MLLNRLRGAAASTGREKEADGETAVRTLLSENGEFAHDPTPVALMRGAVELNKPVTDAGPSGASDALFWELDVLPLPGGDTVLVQTHDVNRDRTLREALVESRKRYKDMVEASSDFVWEIGAGGNFVFVSPGGALGYRADELFDRHPSEFVPGNLSDPDMLSFLAREQVTDVDVWFRRADGSAALLIASATPIFGDKGGWIGARGVCRDATEERDIIFPHSVRWRLDRRLRHAVARHRNPGRDRH